VLWVTAYEANGICKVLQFGCKAVANGATGT
jgi:hypothetical protein